MKTTIISLITALTLFTGCATNSSFQHGGIPKEKYLAGGGFEYVFQAEADGTLYIVEKNTKRIIETKPMKRSEKVSSQISDTEKFATSFEKLYGMPTSEAQIILYFIPDGDA
jgi:hypothetical protein